MGNEKIPMVQGVAVAEPNSAVKVIAPADLPEGYQFMAEANGQELMVQVPAGGVKAGQEFIVESNNVQRSDTFIFGRWKDSLCDCFSYGMCHAHLCLGCFCTPIALAQLMTRMRLTWLGERGSVKQVTKTFKTVVFIFVAVLLLDQALAITMVSLYHELTPDTTYDYINGTTSTDIPTGAIVMQFIRETLRFLFGLYLLIITCRTRQVLRADYQIPEKNCRGCEDCCCSFCCQTCVTMQMMRHTADYDNTTSTCCTETGLPAEIV